jgi:hypothetical protein
MRAVRILLVALGLVTAFLVAEGLLLPSERRGLWVVGAGLFLFLVLLLFLLVFESRLTRYITEEPVSQASGGRAAGRIRQWLPVCFLLALQPVGAAIVSALSEFYNVVPPWVATRWGSCALYEGGALVGVVISLGFVCRKLWAWWALCVVSALYAAAGGMLMGWLAVWAYSTDFGARSYQGEPGFVLDVPVVVVSYTIASAAFFVLTFTTRFDRPGCRTTP